MTKMKIHPYVYILLIFLIFLVNLFNQKFYLTLKNNEIQGNNKTRKFPEVMIIGEAKCGK